MMKALRRLIGAVVVCAVTFSVTACATPTERDTYSCNDVALVSTGENGELAIVIDDDASEGVKVVEYRVDFGNGSEMRATPGTPILYPLDIPPGTYTLTVTLIVERSDGSRAAVTSVRCQPTVKVTETSRPSFLST